MRLESLDWLGPKVATVCGAVAGSLGTGMALAGEAVMQLVGVPLPVVMGSAAGAGIARSLSDSTGFFRALGVTALWTLAGCAGAPLVQTLIQVGLAQFGSTATLPGGALAGVAALIASGPAWGPKVWPLVQQRFFPGKGGGNA